MSDADGDSLDDKVLINLLAELAGCEEELAAAEYAITRRAARERDLGELQAEYEADAARARDEDRDVNERLRSTESAIRSGEAELAAKQDELVGLADRRQYQARQKEIEILQAKLARLEEEAFALLDAVEAAEHGSGTAEADRSRQAQRGEREREGLVGQAERATSAIGAISEEVDRLVHMLPEAVKRQVLRLRSDGGRAVVRVENGACGGCFAQLPAQQGIDADKGRAVVRCASCARYVVHRPWR